MIPLLFLLITLFFNVNTLAAALPAGNEVGQLFSGKTLNPRQLLKDGAAVNCCTSCTSAYSYDTYWHVFDDFCTWAGNGLELWTSQTYSTGSYYCQAGSSTCIHLSVEYLCGDGSAYAMSYGGCMGYFLDAINPKGICNGPPYPGAMVTSSDNCWIFKATADKPSSAAAIASVSDVASTCSGRSCPEANPVKHKFSSTAE